MVAPLMLWRGRPVLVTGASGLIGSHLVSRLVDAGADVTVLVRDLDGASPLAAIVGAGRCRVVRGVLEAYADVERAFVESDARTVFHLGAQTLVPVAARIPLATFAANVMGTAHVLEAVRRHGKVAHVIVASSDKAYGSAGEHPYTEELPLRGAQPYDASKAAAETLIRSYGEAYGVAVATLRCANTYGPGDLNWSRLIPGALRAALRGEVLEIRSDGAPVRDYIHVTDVVSAYLLVAERFDAEGLAGAVFNVGTEHATSVLEVLDTLDEVLRVGGVGALKRRVLGIAEHEIPFQVLDSSRIRSRLGWHPSVSLADGLRETLPWYRTLLGAT